MTDDTNFLGIGWSFPPSFELNDYSSGAVMVEGIENVAQSVRVLLSTSLGERTMLVDYGANLDQFLFEEADQRLIRKLEELILEAILKYESRVIVDSIEINQDPEQVGLLHIYIEYLIRNTNTRDNLVFPFYINEGIDVGV